MPIITEPYNITAILTVIVLLSLTLLVLIIFLMKQNLERANMDKEEYRTKAERDSLTGLLNHASTEEYIKEHMSQKPGEELCALFVIDLDHFKDVNDTLGHQAGDDILLKVAVIIKECFRSEDVVGRIGGDEFMVYLSRVPGMTVVLRKARQLVEELQFHMENEGQEVFMSASVGVAVFTAGDTYDNLYKKADNALYEAKEKGRNQYVIDDGTGGVMLADEVARQKQQPSLTSIQLQTLMENMAGGVLMFEVTPTAKLLYESPSFAKISGKVYDVGSRALSLLDYIDPDAVDELRAVLRNGAKDYVPVDFSYRAKSEAGDYCWRHIRAVRIRNEEYKVPVMIAVVTDITELKKANALLTAIVNNSPLGIGVFDITKAFKPVYVNSVFLDMFNFTKDGFFHMAGDDVLKLIDEKDAIMVRQLIEKSAVSHNTEEIIYRPRNREGIEDGRSIRATGLLLPDTGNQRMTLIMFKDVTHQRFDD